MPSRDDDDHERFARLWSKAQPLVAGYILSLIGDSHQAEDVLQNTAIACIRKMPLYDTHRSFAAWAVGVARFEVLASRRNLSRSFLTYQPDLVDAVSAACEELAESESDTAALHRCLEGVRGRAWEALKLRYEADLDPATIGERLGMAAGSVRVLLSRVRAELRACIERRLRCDRAEA